MTVLTDVCSLWKVDLLLTPGFAASNRMMQPLGPLLLLWCHGLQSKWFAVEV